MRSSANVRPAHKMSATFEFTSVLRFAILLTSTILAYDRDAQAQDLSQFLVRDQPAHLTLRLFFAGYGAEKYSTTHEGFELTQTVTQGISLVGRATSYQIFQGTGFDSPLAPSSHSSTRNFGRLEGGVSLTPFQGTTFTLLGGEDIGDSDAPVFENSFSSWLWLQSRHPVNFAYGTNHYFENGVTNGLIDVRMVAASTGSWMLLLGAGGAVWGGGSVGQAKGQGGPDVGIFFRKWHVSLDLQAGYGSSNTYGTLSLSRNFVWEE
jgi:hypothetical protein